jgi:hypothetical protein
MPVKRKFKLNYQFPGTQWLYLRDLPDGSYGQRRVECRCGGCGKRYSGSLNGAYFGKGKCCKRCVHKARRELFAANYPFPGTLWVYLRDVPIHSRRRRCLASTNLSGQRQP